MGAGATRYIVKQMIAVGVGLLGFFILSSLNYQLFRNYPSVLYILTTLALALVLIIGKRINGAKSWIVLGPLSIEPVEFARIGFVVVAASLLDRSENELGSFRFLALLFALAGGHMLLILMEPYLGGSLVYIPLVMGMLYFAGVRPLYLLAIMFFGGVAAGIPILSTYFSVQPQGFAHHAILQFVVQAAHGGRPTIEFLFLTTAAIFALWWLAWKLHIRLPWQYPLLLALIVAVGVGAAHVAEHSVKDYQRKRIMVFLSPGFDPLGAGYHILQSEIAIGSGQFFGKGLFSGTQSQLGFLPEQHTDFIYSVIGEELGFIWASLVIAAFGLLIWRAFVIATETQDRFGALIAAGIGCLFGFQAILNIGMVIGLLPVTGVALPFISYGGSHMVSALLAIGLLQSVNFRRYIY